MHEESPERRESMVYLLHAVISAIKDTMHSEIDIDIEDSGPLSKIACNIGEGYTPDFVAISRLQVHEQVREMAREIIDDHCPWGDGAKHVFRRTLTFTSARAALLWVDVINCELVLVHFLKRLLQAASMSGTI